LSLLLKIDIPWFLNWGKTSCYTHHIFLLGFPTGWSFTTHKESSGAITHAPARHLILEAVTSLVCFFDYYLGTRLLVLFLARDQIAV
jgi:hypothetical protein